MITPSLLREMRGSHPTLCAWLCALCVTACQGTIESSAGATGAHSRSGRAAPGANADNGDAGPAATGAGDPNGAGSDPAFVFTCDDPSARGASDLKLRRLTQPELVATLRDLLGADILADTEIQTQLGLLTADRVVTSILDVADSPPETQPAAMLEIALRAAELVTANEAATKRVFGACASTSAFADACLRAFVSGFGQKVYRRPLEAAETDSLVAQYRAAGDSAEGMRRILGRLLMAPALVFHIETGSTSERGRVRLTDYEVASRLAYRLTGTMPDEPLLQAAAASLNTLEPLRAQAQRLIANDAFHERVRDFFRFYVQLYSIPTPNAFAARLDGIADAVKLQVELGQETLDFVDNVLWTQHGGFSELLTSTQVFPRSAEMARILETKPVRGDAPVQTTPDHAGILLRPGFLAEAGKLTRPYHRALRIRAGMLCESFGLPDPKAIASRRDQLGDTSQLSNRERLTAETNAPLCLSCHHTLNPVGFVLEGYDQLGMKRTLESDFDEQSGAVLRTHPIDTTVTDTFIRDDSGVVDAFADARDLVRALAAGIDARGCFAQRVFEYQRVRPMTPDDACALRDVENALAQGSVVDAFIASVVNGDIFYKAEGH